MLQPKQCVAGVRMGIKPLHLPPYEQPPVAQTNRFAASGVLLLLFSPRQKDNRRLPRL